MTDNERIAAKAHELWVADGSPHGRDLDHWTQAREIIAIEDSEGDTLLPRETGAETVAEVETASFAKDGDVPGLTDTGEHDLTATSREPAVTAPRKAAAKTASTRADAAKTSPAVVAAKKPRAKAKSKAR